ncbi:MAG: murein hydrolase activator EnvC family protein [Solirubrobacteraceae bacterium]
MAGAALIAGAATAGATSPGQLQQKISSGRQHVSSLAGALAAANRKVGQLDASVAATSSQLDRIQSDLNAKRAQLLALRVQLTAAQTRLQHLQATEVADEQVLAQQLVGSYEGARPDIVSVVLEATGFNDLLERLDFAQRIGRHNAHIVGTVKAARRAVASEAIRLGVLSARQQRLTEQVLTERNRVASLRISLVSERLSAARARDAKAGQLASAKSQVDSLSAQLSRLEAAQRAAAQRAAQQSAGSGSSGSSTGSGSSGSGSSGSGSSSSGPPPSAPSSNGFTFPMPRGSVSPPATWSLDDGVDISAPGGTPELAVCSGTVVLHGIGGFGPSAPVLHCDSPLAGYDYVYYGHAGPGNWTPIGTHVSQGQVISEVGSGIVGISSGPHLEIGFADSSGSPVGPSSAPAMMSLLRSAYGA